ncbi:DNA mismatch repair endonuclease MutL [Fusobacterium sp.]|nr:DNA mismatch repair endonuclease MutL [Fusobacterium sp.]
MGIIKILDEKVSNMIAAGEVVENPASMVKELLENSIDAKSTYIKINIKNGNRYVKISDNGKGMTKDDVLLSVERHATSKISTKEDLSNILTYGFRGEALSSISAVSKMSISSKTAEDSIGTFISLSGGKVTNLKEVQREKGTEIEIKDLFFNTPARLKFLRKESTEFRYIKDIVTQEALANPNISIILSFEDKEVLRTSGRGMKNTILEIFGKNTLQNVVSFPLGFLGNTSLNRSNKDGIFVFINNRPVKSKIIEEALIDGYYTKLMKGRYPFAILFIEIDPKEVDVNVHPSKKIVKFSDEKYIYDYVHDAVIEKLIGDEDFVTPSIPITNKSENNFLDVSDFTDFTPKTFKEEVIKSEPMSFDIPEPVKNYEVNDFNILDSFNKSSEENKEDTSSFENTSYNFSN